MDLRQERHPRLPAINLRFVWEWAVQTLEGADPQVATN